MAIEKLTEVTKFEMQADGRVSLRWTTVFTENGVPASKPAHHRDMREPGADISDLPDDVGSVLSAYWTPSRIAAWQEIKAAQSETIL